VLVITPCAEHGSSFDLVRAAYHLGNRHVQIELKPDHLKIEPDHVLADMLRAMHLTVQEAQVAFEPEGGAYSAGGHSHGHHEHAHEHVQEHDHNHAHENTPPAAEPARGKPLGIPIKGEAAPHVHGPGCGHDHGHSH
jgi:urease accessory protein